MQDRDTDGPKWSRTNSFAALCLTIFLFGLLIYLLLLPETFHRLRDGFLLGILPVFTVSLMLVCSVSIIFDRKRNEPFHAAAHDYRLNWIMFGLVIAALASIYLYYILMLAAGYLLATLLYLPALMYAMGIRSLKPLIAGTVAITIFVFVIFLLLGFHLPSGRIFT